MSEKGTTICSATAVSQIVALALIGLVSCSNTPATMDPIACPAVASANEYVQIQLPGDAGAAICVQLHRTQLVVRIADEYDRTIEYWAALTDNVYWKDWTSFAVENARYLPEQNVGPCRSQDGEMIIVADGGIMTSEFRVGAVSGRLRRQAGGGEFFRTACPDKGTALIETLASEFLTRANFRKSRYCSELPGYDHCTGEADK